METDVLVIGGGLAGYCAAHAAAEAGAQVLLLEKQPEIGGSSVLSAGIIALAGTDMQKAAGIDDSPERLLNDLKTAGGGQNDERLLNIYIDKQISAYEWLKQIGLPFKPVEQKTGAAQSAPRSHCVDPHDLVHRIADVAHSTGRVRCLLNSPAHRLIRPCSGDPVGGVLAAIKGKSTRIRARRGVILASGGFSRNDEWLRLFVPHQARAVRYGGAGNTGDGIRMAWALGAGFRDMGYIKGTFGFHVNAHKQEGRDWTKLMVYRGGIAVNKTGRRYVDESLPYKLLGDAVLQQPDAMAWQIFDQGIMDTRADKDPASEGLPPFNFGEAVERRLVVEAGTLTELAEKIGIDPGQLAQTVERYNRQVAQGKDEDFGRDGLSTHFGALVKIDKAPFYAYATTSGLIATYCGLTVDEQTRVIDVHGEVIRNLYAAGELMGGFHGVAYMSGSSLGKCIIFGKIAGANAACA